MSEDDSPFVTFVRLDRDPFERLVGDTDENLPLRDARDRLGVSLERLVALARAVACIRGQNNTGCGFLLDENLLVTCHHVLPTPDALRAARISFNLLGEDGGSTGLVGVRPLPETFRTDATLDWTVVRVVPEAPGELPRALRRATRAVRRSEQVTVIHRKNGKLVRSDAWSRAERDDLGSRLRHEADTYDGSSGAPVFNADWEVVALHTGSGPADPTRGASVLYNRATSLEAIPT